MIRNTICLPGFMCGPGLFDDLGAALGDRLALLHGDVYSDPSIEGMARRVLAAAPERFVLLGFSMGGFVAREIALTAPERVEAMVLVATSARATSPAEHARKEAILAQLAETGFKGMSRKALARGIHPDHPDRDALVARLKAMGADLGGAVMTRQLQATREDGYRDLPRIAAPTLVIAGRQDVLRPMDELERLAAGIPGARFEVFEECGHMVPLEKPDQLAESITAFLDAL
ncbi:alpha/beta fold hydrolase [Thalassobaculum sp. OXR-137]|uniref:alpha/beta fold hydrolase n=1 Tax=Thalassobaculum sp. OXR-137 TaxID=3100173 RepID=UPI002AC9C59B|nr:alpha/beta fold hydrolase [Thalassobaculum sp. OXR-137]WPZ35348.1 alpha/beta fold hydrolase [Thalassobaculum sp. OXR-137]